MGSARGVAVRGFFLAALLTQSAAGALPVPPVSAQDEADEGDGRSLEIGVRGSKGREANTRDFDWGPTLSYELMASARERHNRFRYELELSYNDAVTEFESADSRQSTRVRAAEFRYAKVSLLEFFGFDLRKRVGVVPYVSGGIQHIDSREDSSSWDEDLGAFTGETVRERYWSPTFGFGAELALNKRVSLALDYDRNTEGGRRRYSRLSFELKCAVFGGE